LKMSDMKKALFVTLLLISAVTADADTQLEYYDSQDLTLKEENELTLASPN